jgi:uncharacterized protein YmfQ (DUF2313 family)
MTQHADILKALIPVELEGDQATDLTVEGAHMDSLYALAEQLLLEMYPDTATDTIADWERTCGITVDETDTISRRRARVLEIVRRVGGLSKQYFISLAAALGHTIEIENYFPFVAGHGRAGERVAVANIGWQVKIKGLSQSGYFFRAGHSRAGEKLGYNSDSIEVLFADLKPAHVKFVYEYSY